MRIPWGQSRSIANAFLNTSGYLVVGCLSFEERSLHIPISAKKHFNHCSVENILLRVETKEEVIPDYRQRAKEIIDENENKLKDMNVGFKPIPCELLADENYLFHLYRRIVNKYNTGTIIVDVSSMPKRYFCFILKKFMTSQDTRNIIVTYTQPELGGYADPQRGGKELSACPRRGEALPAFLSPVTKKANRVVISMGFENLNIESILRDNSSCRDIKIIVSYPPNGRYFSRQWNNLKRIVHECFGGSHNFGRDSIEVISALEVERVYSILDKWEKQSDGLVLLPYGPKPHSIAMAMFAVQNGAGVYYSQPQAYNPDYTHGVGNSWAYVVKWDGIKCYNRTNR